MIGLSSLGGGKVVWEGDHVRLTFTAKDSKGITKHVVSQVSARLRKLGNIDAELPTSGLCCVLQAMLSHILSTNESSTVRELLKFMCCAYMCSVHVVW